MVWALNVGTETAKNLIVTPAKAGANLEILGWIPDQVRDDSWWVWKDLARLRQWAVSIPGSCLLISEDQLLPKPRCHSRESGNLSVGIEIPAFGGMTRWMGKQGW